MDTSATGRPESWVLELDFVTQFVKNGIDTNEGIKTEKKKNKEKGKKKERKNDVELTNCFFRNPAFELYMYVSPFF
jgi:hypothetical protein